MPTLSLAAVMLIVTVVPTAANPIDDLTGFYVADQNDCLYANGTLYLCKDGNCISQDYNLGALTSPEFLEGSATEIAADGIDANGFSVATGDIALSFGNTVRVVRPNGDSLLTTNAGRRIGQTTITFIRDGVAVDPSAKAQNLKLCPAYAEVAQQWLAEGRAPHRVEPQAPKATALELEKFASLIPLQFRPPNQYAHITQVIPVTLSDPEYPALVVLWVFGLGGKLLPLQVLTFNYTTRTYVDNPAVVFAAGIPPEVDYSSEVTVFRSEYGNGLFVSNTGLDRAPFTRALNNLLLPNSQGLLVDYSKSLIQEMEFSHDSTSGIINRRGDVGIYANSMYIPHYYILRDDRLIKANDRLPRDVNRDDKKFTTSALTDINADGIADLVLGTADESRDRSVVYMNDGNGSFQSKPITLPHTPFPERKKQFVDEMTGAIVVDIQPVKLEDNQQYSDLILISTDQYAGHAIQLLKNDGAGNFNDVTKERFATPESAYFNPSAKAFDFMHRAVLFETDQGVDIITKSAARFSTPSYVFGNNGDNTFSVVKERIGTNAITGAATFGGVDMLIEIGADNQSIYLTTYPN